MSFVFCRNVKELFTLLRIFKLKMYKTFINVKKSYNHLMILKTKLVFFKV